VDLFLLEEGRGLACRPRASLYDFSGLKLSATPSKNQVK
jgi:3-deoxy-D-arabino-heptulosonate 7-phosphate (DAHP) synthase